MNEMRVMTPAERKYSYRQSQQISMQTGLVGYLRADMGSNGNDFYSSWNDFRKSLNTEEFRQEFDGIINQHREEGGMLSNRRALSSFCKVTPDSAFSNGRNEYGMRIDTDKYAYLLRLNPNPGEYNLYCYCYERNWLDHHLSEAERGIRFITPEYKTLFTLSDGDQVRIARDDGSSRDYVCRYIDQTHLEVNDGTNSLYHICEFAELMERSGGIVTPLRSSLPEHCYMFIETTNEIGIVKKGEMGYYRTDLSTADRDWNRKLVAEANQRGGVTKAQEEAMKCGSMYGWDCPAADPQNYDDNGIPTKPKKTKDITR